MSNITVPAALRDELPADLDLASATITTYRDLCDTRLEAGVGPLGVDAERGAVIDHDAVVVIAAGFVADDGGAEAEYPQAESAAEAAQDYVDEGGWNPVDSTSWIHVYAWRRGYVLDEDGELVRLTIDRDSHTAAIEPDEPECDDDGGHDWQSPYEVLGGIEENPGVWGKGGGVVISEVCAHCGRYRITDTWAQDRSTGEQGLTSIKYEDADEASERWARAKPEDEILELVRVHGDDAVASVIEARMEAAEVFIDHDGEVLIDRWYRGSDLVDIVDAVRDALDD